MKPTYFAQIWQSLKPKPLDADSDESAVKIAQTTYADNLMHVLRVEPGENEGTVIHENYED